MYSERTFCDNYKKIPVIEQSLKPGFHGVVEHARTLMPRSKVALLKEWSWFFYNKKISL